MKSLKHASMYALAAIIVSIAISMCLHLAGMYESWLNYLSYLAYGVAAVIGVRAWRNSERGGYLTYGQAFGYCTWVALIFSLGMAVWAYVFFEYIGHDEILRLQGEKMAEQAVVMKTKYHLSDEQIRDSFEMGKKFMNGGFISIMALFMNMFLLCVVNLIMAAILKKDAPAGSDQTNSSAV